MPRARERLIFWLLLAMTFAIRAIHPGQPIVENYVGRQIPTAMVGRNLERGSGFLRPQLDTGPFPNLFLVEPPIYAQAVVAVRPILGFELEATGRLISAAATMLGAWGLYGLVRRREGVTVALLALASFGSFPVMIRYGRAFQPDALMVGCVLAGLRGWDEYNDEGNWRWAAFGGFMLAIGLALKITVAWALIPFVLIVRRWPIGWRVGASVAMLVPAFAWYLYAWGEVTRTGSGSLASFDNANLWARSLSTEAWLRFSTYENLARGLVVRSFTPIGFVLALWGLIASNLAFLGWPGSAVLRNPGCSNIGQTPDRGCGVPQTPATPGLTTLMPELIPKVDRLWLGWGIGCILAILGLAAKWHHAYYWMVVAPLASVGVARGLVGLAKLGRFGMPLAATLGSSFLALCVAQSASTWRTPHEWASLQDAATFIKSLTADDQLVAAPEAVLYYSERRGYRLEFDEVAMHRAAGEWGGSIVLGVEPDPLALTEYYVRRQSKHVYGDCVFGHGPFCRAAHGREASLLVADVGSTTDDPGRRAWREAIRKRPDTKVVVAQPGLLVAELHRFD